MVLWLYFVDTHKTDGVWSDFPSNSITIMGDTEKSLLDYQTSGLTSMTIHSNFFCPNNFLQFTVSNTHLSSLVKKRQQTGTERRESMPKIFSAFENFELKRKVHKKYLLSVFNDYIIYSI